MVTVNEELNAVRDYYITRLTSSVDKIQAGDDNTTPTAGDTAIGNLLETLAVETTDTDTAGKILWRARAGITSFVGDTVREVTSYDSTTTKIKTRNLTTAKLKGGDQIFWFSLQTSIRVINE